jgi:hypothetical protein
MIRKKKLWKETLLNNWNYLKIIMNLIIVNLTKIQSLLNN